MKLAILADVHSNLAALQAVMDDIQSWSPDCVIAAGDIVNRGPRPLECFQLIDERVKTEDWKILRGNHEDYVLHHHQPDSPRNGPEFEVHRASYWTYKKLTPAIPNLEELRLTMSLSDPIGNEVRITHASMRGIRDGIYPGMSDERILAKLGDPPVLFCVGHTHIPFVRQIDGTLVVNVGSAGLPFDGDTRPSYARLTWKKGTWNARIIRVRYDLQEAEKDFFITGYIDEAGPLTRLVLVELRNARSQLFQWAKYYQELVLSGEHTMNQAVEEFLQRDL